MATAKPRIVVLGGLGFIGRNLVQYLSENDLASKILVSDKALPALAGLTKKQSEIFNSEVILFKQANLAREATVKTLFGLDGGNWDYVINLAGETKYSQTDEVYKENIIDVSTTCANIAAQVGVKRYIEVSTAQIYDSGKKPSAEDAKVKPWTKLAKAKHEAEEEIKKIKGLPVVIVRPAIVYGPGDITGVTPRLICAAVYKFLEEKMEFLWDKDLKINTVHVYDVVAALHWLLTNGTEGGVYNLCDSGDTDQESVARILESIFKIKSNFMGNIKSKVATSVAMKTVAETANEKHLKPWSDLCKSKNINNTPLTPYLDEELLYQNATSIDGCKIANEGFQYKYPKITEDSLREVLTKFIELEFFPADFL